MRFLSGSIVFALLVGSAQAQTLFRADLNGAQEVPPVTTDAGGWAKFVLNSNDTLTYDVRTWLITGTGATIEVGAAGTNGPVLFTLSGGPNVWSGTTAALTSTDKANLRANGLYVNVQTAAHAAGEIRGQIVIRPLVFGAHLTGDQEIPPTGSAGVGEATFIVNSDNTITYDVMITGFTGTVSHIHTGAFGVNGGILFGLSGSSPHWSGTTPAMNATQFNNLQANGLYVNVHSSTFSLGEIRGQIVPTEVPYGFGSPSSVGVPTLSASGAAMRGGTLALSLTGGLPNGVGLLFFSLSDGSAALKKVPFLVGPAILVVGVPLDGMGGFVLQDVVPDLTASADVYLQYFGFEPGGPNGNLYATNGVLLSIFDY